MSSSGLFVPKPSSYLAKQALSVGWAAGTVRGSPPASVAIVTQLVTQAIQGIFGPRGECASTPVLGECWRYDPNPDGWKDFIMMGILRSEHTTQAGIPGWADSAHSPTG